MTSHFTDPFELVQSVTRALRLSDWHGVAELCDPVSLRAFKREHIQRLERDRSHAALTVEQLMQQNPDMPRNVAEYHAAQHQQSGGAGTSLQRQFPTINSIEQLQLLDPADVFAAWLDGRSPQRLLATMVDAGHLTAEQRATMVAQLTEQLHTFHLLGVLHVDTDVALIAYGPTFPDTSELSDSDVDDEGATQNASVPADERQLAIESMRFDMVRIARCRKQADGTWRVHASGDFFSVDSTGFSIELDETPDN